MSIKLTVLLGAVLFATINTRSASAQQVTKATVPGVTNFSRLETTIACAGATTPEAIPAIKEMGYKSVINMRLADEAGANVDAEAIAAKNAGLRFIHIPFNGSSPDPKVAEYFLTAVANPENMPAFIHCASGNRVAAMWMIKRMVVDHWDAEKAGAEATALGLTNANLKKFAVEYSESRSKQ
jgi:uncharacterized protein (TIGR01244 family)